MFLVKVVPKLCSKFTGGHSCQSVISILICNFVEITLPHWCSPVNWLYIFGTPFPKNTYERLLLNGSRTATWIFLLCLFHFMRWLNASRSKFYQILIKWFQESEQSLWTFNENFGQTHFENLATNAARFLKCAWPFMTKLF